MIENYQVIFASVPPEAIVTRLDARLEEKQHQLGSKDSDLGSSPLAVSIRDVTLNTSRNHIPAIGGL